MFGRKPSWPCADFKSVRRRVAIPKSRIIFPGATRGAKTHEKESGIPLAPLSFVAVIAEGKQPSERRTSGSGSCEARHFMAPGLPVTKRKRNMLSSDTLQPIAALMVKKYRQSNALN